jgi:uncharacterized protein (TIGR02996 family)
MSAAPGQQSKMDERLKAIIAEPERDDLRLSYANALDESGDADHALLVRLQVRLSTLPGGVDHPEWFRLNSKIHKLLLARGRDWVPSWYEKWGIRDAEFDRGLVEYVTVPAARLIDSETRGWLFESRPIRHVNLVELRGSGIDSPFGSILNSLEHDDVGGRILSLSAEGQGLGDRDAMALAKSVLRNLRWLSLAFNSVGIAGVTALAEASQGSGRLANLHYVNLEGNPADPVERVFEDQNVVVGRHKPKIQEGLPSASWYLRKVVGGHVVTPDRLSVSHVNEMLVS